MAAKINRMNSNVRKAIEVVETIVHGAKVTRLASDNLGSAIICGWRDLPLMKMRSIKNRLSRAKVKFQANGTDLVLLAPANFNFVGRCEKFAKELTAA